MTWLGQVVVCNDCGAAAPARLDDPLRDGWVAIGHHDWCPVCWADREAAYAGTV